jgi:hypothetical protein
MKQKTLEQVEAEFRRRRLEIRADPALSWEKKELAVRQLGLEHREALKQLEEAA